MRVYQGRIELTAKAIVQQLVQSELIDTSNPDAVQQDIAAVLNAYVRDERAVQQEARQIVASSNLSHHELARVRRLVAQRNGVGIGDDALDYLLDKLVEKLMNSVAVDEVYADDLQLRRTMAVMIKQNMTYDEELDEQVRARLKHLQQGTAEWEIEYQKVLQELRRRKGL